MEKTLQSLLEQVAAAGDFTAEQIIRKDRAADLTLVRQLFCWIAHREGYSTKRIGKLINRDHTTILYSAQRIDDFLSINDKETLRLLKKTITLITKN
jgi:chromosomal replication initiation ATPase DnaA